MSCKSSDKNATKASCDAVAKNMNDNTWYAACYNGELSVYGGGDSSDAPEALCSDYLPGNASCCPGTFVPTDNSCYECAENFTQRRENYTPCCRPQPYVPVSQTWGIQKPYTL